MFSSKSKKPDTQPARADSVLAHQLAGHERSFKEFKIDLDGVLHDIRIQNRAIGYCSLQELMDIYTQKIDTLDPPQSIKDLDEQTENAIRNSERKTTQHIQNLQLIQSKIRIELEKKATREEIEKLIEATLEPAKDLCTENGSKFQIISANIATIKKHFNQFKNARIQANIEKEKQKNLAITQQLAELDVIKEQLNAANSMLISIQNEIKNAPPESQSIRLQDATKKMGFIHSGAELEEILTGRQIFPFHLPIEITAEDFETQFHQHRQTIKSLMLAVQENIVSYQQTIQQKIQALNKLKATPVAEIKELDTDPKIADLKKQTGHLHAYTTIIENTFKEEKQYLCKEKKSTLKLNRKITTIEENHTFIRQKLQQELNEQLTQITKQYEYKETKPAVTEKDNTLEKGNMIGLMSDTVNITLKKLLPFFDQHNFTGFNIKTKHRIAFKTQKITLFELDLLKPQEKLQILKDIQFISTQRHHEMLENKESQNINFHTLHQYKVADRMYFVFYQALKDINLDALIFDHTALEYNIFQAIQSFERSVVAERDELYKQQQEAKAIALKAQEQKQTSEEAAKQSILDQIHGAISAACAAGVIEAKFLDHIKPTEDNITILLKLLQKIAPNHTKDHDFNKKTQAIIFTQALSMFKPDEIEPNQFKQIAQLLKIQFERAFPDQKMQTVIEQERTGYQQAFAEIKAFLDKNHDKLPNVKSRKTFGETYNPHFIANKIKITTEKKDSIENPLTALTKIQQILIDEVAIIKNHQNRSFTPAEIEKIKTPADQVFAKLFSCLMALEPCDTLLSRLKQLYQPIQAIHKP